MKRGAALLLLLLLGVLSDCAPQRPAILRTGYLAAGATILVRNSAGDIDAYAPARGQAANQYTVAAYGPSSANVTIAVRPPLVVARARANGTRFLVRSPANCALDLAAARGNINVADVGGVVNAHTDSGDIKMLIPLYGNASTGRGNISVIYASTDWPGTLRFSTLRGNVELYVNEHAKAVVHLHTDNGTVFSDFDLRGTSSGTSETINAGINGGGPRSIEVHVRTGSIRLMQLKPQV